MIHNVCGITDKRPKLYHVYQSGDDEKRTPFSLV